MYNLEIRESVDGIFKKLFKKDKVSLEYINKKILEIRENPYHGLEEILEHELSHIARGDL